jgi:membrane-bound lytic murein transglycosylase A
MSFALSAFRLTLLLLLASCTNTWQQTSEPKILRQTGLSAPVTLPGWEGEDFIAMRQAMLHSCPRLSRRALGKTALEQKYPERLNAARWRDICAGLKDAASPQAARHFFENNFQALALGEQGREIGLVTGYYEAELRASKTKTATYRYPIYALPDERDLDLTRADIDNGALAGRGLELLWADDPVSVFTLHIQGSGRAVLPDGTAMHIGFAGKNRHAYYSIGKTFGAEKLLPSAQINMDAIEDWLRQNPSQAARVMQTNPSYIFFRPVPRDPDGIDGPIGAYGIALIAGRSIAVDRSLYPLGVPFWLDIPAQSDIPAKQQFAVAHDTGSAILGAVRADYFFGAGPVAKRLAGAMIGRGRMHILLPTAPLQLTGR